MTDATFEAFGFATPILAALKHAGFIKPTPIQAGAIPHGLARKDVLGLAQTGTGKTAAFALPILQVMAGHKLHNRRFSTRALILAPTRELAVQIEQDSRNSAPGLACAWCSSWAAWAAPGRFRAWRAGRTLSSAAPAACWT